MKVKNNGQKIIIEASYFEAASLVEALRNGAYFYEQQNAPEFAKVTRELIHELLNGQIIDPESR